MKYLLLLAAAAAALWFYQHREPSPDPVTGTSPQGGVTTPAATPWPATAPAPAEAPGQAASNYLKRPLDRAREVTGDAKKRNAVSEF